MSFAPARLPRGRHRAVLPGIGVAAAALFAAVQTGLVPASDLEQGLTDLSDSLGAWTYLVVGALAFLETGALVAPGPRGFLPWSILGTGLWATTFTLVGYAFHDSFSSAAGNLTHGALALAVIAAAISGLARASAYAPCFRSDCSEIVSNRIRASAGSPAITRSKYLT